MTQPATERKLRILDCGAHDGFVSAWLRDRHPGQLQLDGLELNSQFAAQAVKRGVNCKIGAAEDAPLLFKPGTYDAVIAYELIEHVPDMNRLLAALEQMLNPTGRIYVSTPDGTFGQGHNPHHLRALRSIDLADLLRRRGTLQDFAVGQDGLSIASYTPAPRKGDIAVCCGPGWQQWAPMDILTKGLGGSETAAVRLAEQLSLQGYVVTVYGDVAEGAFRDVLYRRWETFDPTDTRLAVISSRLPEVFDRPMAAVRRLLWLHDVDCGDRLTPERAREIDHLMVLSDWHRRHVQGTYPFLTDPAPPRLTATLTAGHASARPALPDRIVQTRNGVAMDLFDTPDVPRAPRVLYTSSPDRGLDILLELWPQVLEQVPDAQLHHAYSPVYYEMATKDPVLGAFAQRIADLSAQPGVTALGSLTQPQVARLMRESRVWCAPSYHSPSGQPFHETSCIGAMEAQAAGCRVVASNWGALPETARCGALIDGPPNSTRWRNGFVKAIVEGLANPKVQAYADAVGPEFASHLSWAGVAEDFARVIEGDTSGPGNE